MDAANHRVEGDAPAGVSLRIEEHLRIHDILLMGFLQVLPRQLEEILLVPERTFMALW